MRKILFVIPTLEPSPTAHQLSLLATALPRDRFDLRIYVLGNDSPLTASLRSAGIIVETLGWKRWFDLDWLVQYRRLVTDFRPDIVHLWRPVAAMFAGLPRARIIVSNLLETRTPVRWLLGPWLRRVDGVAVSSASEADRCLRFGVPPSRIVPIPLAAPLDALAGPASDLRRCLDLPPAVRLLACAGSLDATDGFFDLIWTLDILHYVYPDLHLLMIGEGPAVARLRRFAQCLQVGDRVHFLEPGRFQSDGLAQAEVVWVPNRHKGGTDVALKAMAAGKPVIAARSEALANIVAEGQTGSLYRPGDKAELARRTRRFLDDGEERRRMGQAGRERVLRFFTPLHLAGQFSTVYESACA